MSAPFWIGLIVGVLGTVAARRTGATWAYSSNRGLNRLHYGWGPITRSLPRNHGSFALTDTDHRIISEEFRVHADAIQSQVSQYADSLAHGDPVLRERLRRFEHSGVQVSDATTREFS